MKNMFEEAVCKSRAFALKLGVRLPLMNAPMSDAAGPELAAAVSNAGGLGVLGAGFMSGAEIEQAVARVRSLTDKPFAVGVRIPVQGSSSSLERAKKMAHALEDLALELGLEEHYAWAKMPDFDEQFEAFVSLDVPVLITSCRALSEIYAEKLERLDVKVLSAATTLREAKVLRAADASGIIVQGVEAAGPRLNFEQPDSASQVGLLSLIGPAARATGLAVVAAGGIASGAQWAAAMAAGASGVMLGTAFVRAHESAAAQAFKDQLPYTTDAATRFVRTFEGRLSHVAANGLVEALEEAGIVPGDYPEQCEMMRPILLAAQKAGRADLMQLAAGQGAPLAAAAPAASIVQRLESELDELLGESPFA